MQSSKVAKVKPPGHVPEPRVLGEYLQDLDIREVRLFVLARAVTRDVVLSFASLSSTGGRREIWKYSVAYPVQVFVVGGGGVSRSGRLP